MPRKGWALVGRPDCGDARHVIAFECAKWTARDPDLGGAGLYKLRCGCAGLVVPAADVEKVTGDGVVLLAVLD